MKSLLLSLFQGKKHHNAQDAAQSPKYKRDPLAHPALQRMDSRELGDVYINPEKTLP